MEWQPVNKNNLIKYSKNLFHLQDNFCPEQSFYSAMPDCHFQPMVNQGCAAAIQREHGGGFRLLQYIHLLIYYDPIK